MREGGVGVGGEGEGRRDAREEKKNSCLPYEDLLHRPGFFLLLFSCFLP